MTSMFLYLNITLNIMGTWDRKPEPDPEVRKGIDDIKKEMNQQKKTQLKYLIISVIASGILGFILGKLF